MQGPNEGMGMATLGWGWQHRSEIVVWEHAHGNGEVGMSLQGLRHRDEAMRLMAWEDGDSGFDN